ncbi:MAG: PIG-L family deacetylase [Candidatus Omnitrophica bacterium]|nr:PIG-L family deacetylase [Candidatus Omnitrophota bacterium]MCM8790615.1 PIG-L family deacetylase [Candidatus Omnitrophota bacterium]
MRLLVVSPHPDDETLGAGGTLVEYRKRGWQLFWLNFTDMEVKYGYEHKAVSNRKKEIRMVSERYGFSGVRNLKLRPAGLDTYSQHKLVKMVSEFMNEVKPDTVILPFRNDAHSDHRIVFDAAYSCTKIFRYSYLRRILMMEILSETDFAPAGPVFVPNFFVDISDSIDKKISIMKIYSGQLQKTPFPRSENAIRSLAVCRGASAGCLCAEGFQIIKEIG